MCAGLRSTRVGEQCEAVVKFPLLVDQFPFPVVINAAFLKIAEVFRTGYTKYKFSTVIHFSTVI